MEAMNHETGGLVNRSVKEYRSGMLNSNTVDLNFHQFKWNLIGV